MYQKFDVDIVPPANNVCKYDSPAQVFSCEPSKPYDHFFCRTSAESWFFPVGSLWKTLWKSVNKFMTKKLLLTIIATTKAASWGASLTYYCIRKNKMWYERASNSLSQNPFFLFFFTSFFVCLFVCLIAFVFVFLLRCNLVEQLIIT